MNARDWDRWWQQLGWLPLVGRWLEWETLRATAGEGTPDAFRYLAVQVARGGNGLAARYSFRYLRRFAARLSPSPSDEDRLRIDAVCEVWAGSRHPHLTTLLLSHQWSASQPPALRAVTLLLLSKLELLALCGPELLPGLVCAASDPDGTLRQRAWEVLAGLQHPETREALCRLVIDRDDEVARAVCLSCGYIPREPALAAVFWFLASQWPRYEELDFDRSLLR